MPDDVNPYLEADIRRVLDAADHGELDDEQSSLCIALCALLRGWDDMIDELETMMHQRHPRPPAAPPEPEDAGPTVEFRVTFHRPAE